MPVRQKINHDRLRTLSQRLKLKAEVIEFRLVHRSADKTYFDAIHDFKDKAKSAGTYLWGLDGRFDGHLNALASIAECFKAIADCLVVFVDASKRSGCGIKQSEVLRCLAELVKTAIHHINSIEDLTDVDVSELKICLRSLSNDFKQPFDWRVQPDFDLSILQALKGKIEAWEKHLNAEELRLKKLEELSSLIEGKPDCESHWRLIASKVANHVKDGMKPSDKRLREILLPVFEDIPANDQYPSEFHQVLDTIDSFLARNSDVEEQLLKDDPTPEVEEVRRLLKGTKLVLIGGKMRRAARKQLEKAFELEKLIWSDSKAHQSYKSFTKDIAAKNVGAVCLAIRFCSHDYTKIGSICEKASLPLVRLPAGYGANRVAHEILSQASDRL